MDGEKWEYEVCPIPQSAQHPVGYAECYEYLVSAGFDIVIFDSLSHAWHGAMEKVDAYARANRGDKFGGWAQVTPEQRKMLTTMTDPRAHTIATMRVKSEYERIDDAGKMKIKKVGMKTDQRENTEYEFDAVIRLEVEKPRGACREGSWLHGDGRQDVRPPWPDVWKPLFDWWLSAEPVDAVSPEDHHRRLLNAAKTLPDLATVWGAIPKVLQSRLADDKDRRKAVLANESESRRCRDRFRRGEDTAGVCPTMTTHCSRPAHAPGLPD